MNLSYAGRCGKGEFYEMTTGRKMVRLVFAACLGLSVGCSDSSGERNVVVEAKAPPSPLEQIKVEISNLASNITKGCASDHKYFSDFAENFTVYCRVRQFDTVDSQARRLVKDKTQYYARRDLMLVGVGAMYGF